MSELTDSGKIVKLILKAISLTKEGFRLDVQCHVGLDGYMFLALYWDDDGFRKHYTIRINDK